MHRVQNIIIIASLFFAAYASLVSDTMNKIALYVVLPIAFLLSFLKNGNIEINRIVSKYELILLVLFAWIFISYLWAEYDEAASRELHRCLGSSILSFIFAKNATSKKMIPWLYVTYLIMLISAWNYAQNNIVVEVTGAYENDYGRMNDAKLNANTMAYYTFYTSLVIYLFGEFLENFYLRKTCRYLFFALFPLSFFTALATASRQVLIIQVPFLVFMLFCRYWKGLNWKKKVLFVIIVFSACAALFGYIESVYNNSYLAVRAERNLKDDSRTLLLKDAFNVGMEYFPFGVGAGNYIMYSVSHHFSHISYIELFVNQGIVGVFLYLFLLVFFIKDQISRYKISKDNLFLMFLFFGFMFALDNFFYVFYLDMWLISFFVLVATHSDTYFRDKCIYVVSVDKKLFGKNNYEN